MSAYPKIQAIFFFVYFIVQILLFVLFVDQLFFTEKVDMKTSLEYVEIDDFRYPRITICSSSMYNKTILNGKYVKNGKLKEHYE